MCDSNVNLCSSLCSCPQLIQMHTNFVRKFRVDPLPSPSPSGGDFNAEVPVHNIIDDDEEDIEELVQNVEPTNKIMAIDESQISVDVHFEIIKEDSRTPIPVYEMMSESELNSELAMYGHAAMGRRAAIRLLNKIFEATHPVLSGNTPIPRKIARVMVADRQPDGNARQKRAKAKIIELMETESGSQQKTEGEVQQMKATVGKENRLEETKKEDSLSHVFLKWIRADGNEQIYSDLLLLNPIFFDKLYIPFKKDSDDVRMSKEAFTEVLDRLGITHCARNDPLEDQ